MRDCTHCFNQRVVLNPYFEEVPCPACVEFAKRLIKEAVARRMAREAVKNFVRDLGNRKKAVS
jgi:hypothetical protein